MARRGYPAEFRRRVVDLVEGGRKVSEVATELEVSEQTIYVRAARHGSTQMCAPRRASRIDELAYPIDRLGSDAQSRSGPGGVRTESR
jgi:transposase-like protein